MGTHKGTWKHFEREVAAYFGSHRVPLSGMSNYIQKGDVLHEFLHVECKYRAQWPKYVPLEFAGRLIINGEYVMWCKPVGKNGKKGEEIVAEAILREGTSLEVLFAYTEKEAAEKIPVVALKKKGHVGFVLMCRKEHYEKVKSYVVQN